MSSVNTCYFTSAIFMMKRISNCKEHIWESDRPALTTWYSFVSNPVANYSLFKKRGGGGGSFLSEGEEKKKKKEEELINISQKVNPEVLKQILNKLQGSRNSWRENTIAVSTLP